MRDLKTERDRQERREAGAIRRLRARLLAMQMVQWFPWRGVDAGRTDDGRGGRRCDFWRVEAVFQRVSGEKGLDGFRSGFLAVWRRKIRQGRAGFSVGSAEGMISGG